MTAKIWRGGKWQAVILSLVSSIATIFDNQGRPMVYRIDDDGNVDTGTYRFRIYHIDATEYNGGNYKPQMEAK